MLRVEADFLFDGSGGGIMPETSLRSGSGECLWRELVLGLGTGLGPGDVSLFISLDCAVGGEVCEGVGVGRRGRPELGLPRAAATLHGVRVSRGQQVHTERTENEMPLPLPWQQDYENTLCCGFVIRYNTDLQLHILSQLKGETL